MLFVNTNLKKNSKKTTPKQSVRKASSLAYKFNNSVRLTASHSNGFVLRILKEWIMSSAFSAVAEQRYKNDVLKSRFKGTIEISVAATLTA